jgi:outer membrane autotransporter protein
MTTYAAHQATKLLTPDNIAGACRAVVNNGRDLWVGFQALGERFVAPRNAGPIAAAAAPITAQVELEDEFFDTRDDIAVVDAAADDAVYHDALAYPLAIYQAPDANEVAVYQAPDANEVAVYQAPDANEVAVYQAPVADEEDEVVFVGLDGIDAAVNATIAHNALITNNKNISTATSNKEVASKTPRAIENTTEALHTVLDATAQRTSTMSGIIHAATATSSETASAEGIAAGSGTEKFGVWGQAMSGVANQKARKGASGVKSTMVGGMIGVDTMINDKTILGLSFGNIINNVKHKNANAGDKTRSSSLVATAYGNYKFDNDFFIRGAAAYSNTAVDNKDKRINNAGVNGVARSKYKINSFGGEVAVGKIFTLANDVLVTPSIGARFARTGKISYKETGGAGFDNKVSQKASNSAQAIAGLQVAKSFTKGDFTITPELHANVAYGLGVKAPAGKYTNTAGATTSYRGNKPSRFDSTVGFGVTAESGSFEYGVGYDANISAGYLGHQGAVKLKVKF